MVVIAPLTVCVVSLCPCVQLADLSFAPRICKTSRTLAAKVKKLQNRTEALTTAKDRKMMRVRDQRDHNVR